MESENKLKILFCAIPVKGMMNTCIAIGQSLYRRGHRIIFPVNDDWKNKLCIYGFEEILISDEKCRKLSDETLLNKYIRNGYYDRTKTPLELMGDANSMYRFGRAKEFSETFEKIIDSVKPNIIISECFFIPTVVSIVKSECPWVLLITSNPLRDNHDERLPPQNSGLPSYDTSQWSEFRKEYYRRLMPIKKLLNNWLIEEDLSPLPENRLSLESPFLNIYNYPEEIDYCDLRPLPLNWKRFDAFVRTENEEFHIPQYLNEKSGKLIYFTMGTLLSVNVQMMERLIQIMSKSAHRFIVSKGPFANRYDLPGNMYGERFVPQTKVLPLIDMIIFHGGNNTLVEAFYYGKPMIVMPLCRDGFDNAQRVDEKGFGLRLSPLTCTDDELINAIEKILNDEQLMERMKVISERIQREAKSDKLAHAIEDVLK